MVGSPTPMDNGKKIRLYGYGPAGEPRVGVSHSLQPGKRLVVSLNGERLPKQIHVKETKGPNNDKALLDRGVPGLPG